MAPKDTSSEGGARVRVSAHLAMTIRRWHTYLGVLIAPSVVFFAGTGALQLYSLHKSHGDYHAPVLIRSLSAIHKDQTYVPPPERPQSGPRGGGHDRGPPAGEKAAPVFTPILKGFYLSVALSLTLSTLLGVWMAITFGRRKRLIWSLLVLGAVLPVAIMFI